MNGVRPAEFSRWLSEVWTCAESERGMGAPQDPAVSLMLNPSVLAGANCASAARARRIRAKLGVSSLLSW